MLSAVGIFLLLRILILYVITSFTAAGSIKQLRESRRNCEKQRQVTLKRFNFDDLDLSTLKSLQSDMNSVKGWCEKCNDVKPERAHHCSTCNTCSLRLDHHCPWLNNCIGISNYRFFVQLLLHAFIGSCFTLICCYLGRQSPLWYVVFGNAWVFIAMHVVQAVLWGLYFVYQLWIINRDLTSFDLYMD